MRKFAVLTAIVLVFALSGYATTFSTDGVCGGGGSTAAVVGNAGTTVSAAAQITFNSSAGTVTVLLTNCQTNITTVAQNISDVFFTISNTSGGSFGSQTASYINIAADGSSTSTGPATKNGNPVYWGLDAGGPNFYLNDLGHAGPAETIIGPSWDCGSGGGSICGNDPHNPFIAGSGTFTITGVSFTPGVAYVISDVTISFGTVPQTPPPPGVPEPATMALFGGGLVAIAGMIRRRLS